VRVIDSRGVRAQSLSTFFQRYCAGRGDIDILVGSCADLVRRVSAPKMLSSLRGFVRTLGYKNFAVFIDSLDEAANLNPGNGGGHRILEAVMGSVLDNALLSVGCRFFLFFPFNIAEIRSRAEKVRSDRMLTIDLSWTAHDLMCLLHKRVPDLAKLCAHLPQKESSLQMTCGRSL
jgi:hypothetical protein